MNDYPLQKDLFEALAKHGIRLTGYNIRTPRQRFFARRDEADIIEFTIRGEVKP